jgi:hypothetical protein
MQTLKAIIVCSPAALRDPLDRLKGKMTLLRHLAGLRPGRVTSTMASAKTSLRAIARRWLALDAEIKEHDAHLETLTAERAPQLLAAHGMATGTAAEMLLVVGDNPERIHSEAAFAKLSGACPIPASSGKTKTGRLWVIVRDERPWGSAVPPAAFYRYSVDRKGIYAEALLGTCNGFLHADGYGGFDQLYRPVTSNSEPRPVEVACWSHAHRYFFDEHHRTASPIALDILQRIAARPKATAALLLLSPAA